MISIPIASMGASCTPAADNLVPLGYLIFHRKAGVGEGEAVFRHVPFHTLWSVYVLGEAGIVEDVVTGEELSHSFKVSLGEDLLEPPAD
jgi:hypothetical protein